MYECRFCKNTFSSNNSLFNHTKNCVFRKTPSIKKRTVLIQAKQSVEQTLAQRVSDMEQQIKDIDSKINITPPQTKITQVNVNIIKQLPGCFYEALVEKIGKPEIAKLLGTEFSESGYNAVNVYKKLFPSKRLEDNPIVFSDDGFKYLNSNNEIVTDNEIIDIIAHKIQTALLYASNQLIGQCIKSNNTNQLYDLYDIGEIQRSLSNVNEMKHQLSNYIKLELSPN